MPAYKCRGCDMEPLPYSWRGRPCPGCGGFWSIVIPRNAGENRSRRSIAAFAQAQKKWISTAFPSIDRVLGGGGLVEGSTVFLGGGPGSGKSTLAIQIADGVAQSGRRVLYASNEQSGEDIGDIAERTKCKHEHIEVLGNEGDVYKIMDEAKAMDAALVIIDSLQTVALDDVDAAEGSSAQVTAVADYVTAFAKREKIDGGHRLAVVMICQVNREMTIAGSMKSIHACDTVTYLDKHFDDANDDDDDDEDETEMRLFLVEKNRNGPSGAKALFKLTESGLRPMRRSKLA